MFRTVFHIALKMHLCVSTKGLDRLVTEVPFAAVIKLPQWQVGLAAQSVLKANGKLEDTFQFRDWHAGP